MKTVNQIRKKAEALKSELRNEKVLYENFGYKEQQQLDTFIGNIYEYSYEDRIAITAITSTFFDWCINCDVSELKR